MPLQGEYAPSPVPSIRKQAEDYERTDGREGGTMMGLPVIILTSLGATSGKIRKTPLMRVEHDRTVRRGGVEGRGPDHPNWYHNLVANPLVELQDGAERHDYPPHRHRCGPRGMVGARGLPQYADYAAKTERRSGIRADACVSDADWKRPQTLVGTVGDVFGDLPGRRRRHRPESGDPSIVRDLQPTATQVLWIGDIYSFVLPDYSSRWATWAIVGAANACC